MTASTDSLQKLLQLVRQSDSPNMSFRDAFRVLGTPALDRMTDGDADHLAHVSVAAGGAIAEGLWSHHTRLRKQLAAHRQAPPINRDPAEQHELQGSIVAMLRRLFGLQGEMISSAGDESAGCVCLGQLYRDGRAYDVYFCGAGWDSSLHAFLAERGRASRPSIMLIPTFAGVPFSAIHRYAPGSHVILATLVNLLCVRGERFCVKPSFDSLTDGSGAEIGPGWWIMTQEGKRPIARREYDDIVARRDQFDLFLDGAGTASSQFYSAGYRDRGGRFHPATLSGHQMHALTELISRGVALRARDFRCLEATAIRQPAGTIDTARRSVDLRLSRSEWRTFHTIPAKDRAERRYVFRPPAELCYACIVYGSSDPAPTRQQTASRAGRWRGGARC